MTVQVLFAVEASSQLIETLPCNTILISAEDTDWNDFGFKFRTIAHVVGKEKLELGHFVMFDGSRDTFDFLKKALTEGKPCPLQLLQQKFCSLFAAEQAYADLTRLFGYEATRDALLLLGDGTVLIDLKDDPRYELVQSEAFYLGVLRDPATYRAFRKGGRHVKASIRATVEDAAKSFTIHATLPPRWQQVTVMFDYEADLFLRDRMAVLAGPNGTGKTSLLLALAKAVTMGSEVIIADEVHATFDSTPNFNGLMAITSAASDRYSTIRQTSLGPDYSHFLLIETGSSAFDPLTVALVDAMRDRHEDFAQAPDGASISRGELLEAVLGELGLWTNVYVPVIEGKGVGIPTTSLEGVKYLSIRLWTGGEKRALIATNSADISKQPVFISSFGRRDLSSGELAMFRFAVQLISRVEQGYLLIVDEPETHLHPRFISELMEILDRVLKATRSCAMIATHSPFVVREVPSRRVYVLTGSETGTEALKPRLQTFGAGIDAIADSVFLDSQREHLHERLLDRWLASPEAAGLTIEHIVERYASMLNPETLSYLAQKLMNLEDSENEEEQEA